MPCSSALAKCLKEARRRRDQPLQRLDDDAGDVAAMLVDQGFCKIRIIERRDQHAVPYAFRNAGRVRHRTRKILQPRRGEAHQRLGRHAVIAALEFHDLRAARMRAGKPHGIHVRLAAGADITQLLGAGHRIADRLGELEAGGVVGEEGHADIQLLAHGGVHFLMPVAEDHRSGADHVVDIFLAVLVDDARPGARLDEESWFEIAKAACRHNGAGTFGEFCHRAVVGHDPVPIR